MTSGCADDGMRVGNADMLEEQACSNAGLTCDTVVNFAGGGRTRYKVGMSSLSSG